MAWPGVRTNGSGQRGNWLKSARAGAPHRPGVRAGPTNRLLKAVHRLVDRPLHIIPAVFRSGSEPVQVTIHRLARHTDVGDRAVTRLIGTTLGVPLQLGNLPVKTF